MEGLTGSFFCNEDEVCMENHGRSDGFIFCNEDEVCMENHGRPDGFIFLQ